MASPRLLHQALPRAEPEKRTARRNCYVGEFWGSVLEVMDACGPRSVADICMLSDRRRDAVSAQLWQYWHRGYIRRVKRGVYEITDLGRSFVRARQEVAGA